MWRASNQDRLLKCPECGAKVDRIYRSGTRGTKHGIVQRYLCRECGFRFSERAAKNAKANKATRTDMESARVCAQVPNGAKNLTAATETKSVAGRQSKRKPLPQEAEGHLAKYKAYLDCEGYGKGSRYVGTIHRLLVLGADLLNPEDVKAVIARQPWKDSAKMLACYAYDAFCRMEKIDWSRPKYRQQESLFYVPDEKELDALIAASRSKRMTAFLKCLKETFADPGEVLGLTWKDLSGKIITINKPVKGHLPGQTKISDELLAMLNALPKTSRRIFPTTYNSIGHCMRKLRQNTARKLQNPKIMEITFKSFRHWGGTWLAHITGGNVLAVKKALRHKRVENTMKYIHRLEFKDPQNYDVATATTIEEIKELAKQGFTKFDEANGIHVYRRPKYTS